MFVVVCDLLLLNVIWLTMCYKECKYGRVLYLFLLKLSFIPLRLNLLKNSKPY